MDALDAAITTDLTITASQYGTITNFNFFPHSKMFSKTENILFNNTLYFETKFTDIPGTEGTTVFKIRPPLLKHPKSFFYAFNPGELSRCSYRLNRFILSQIRAVS